ncbi:MAG: DUF4846 domain-containing protein [Prevotellaceae bacterium]|jgi:hypothetical protein|nr:DUF4846 domain-containing protein [Prevotellaceae bacterium]
MQMKSRAYYIVIVFLWCFIPSGSRGQTPIRQNKATVLVRFETPEPYERTDAPPHSFALFLRNLPLLPENTPIQNYANEPLKTDTQSPPAAILDIETGTKNWQRTVQSLMRIWAEYLFEQQRFSAIRFHIRNGKAIPYQQWTQGMNILVDNRAYWTKTPYNPHQYRTFRRYLDFIFQYSDFQTVLRDIESVAASDLAPGDLLLRDDRAMMVLDMAVNRESGERMVLLACGGTPAQAIRVLQNTAQKDVLGAWFKIGEQGAINTGVVEFLPTDFYRFK